MNEHINEMRLKTGHSCRES